MNNDLKISIGHNLAGVQGSKEPMGKQKFLLVENNAGFRSTVKEFLELQGYEVLETDNAQTAKEIVASQSQNLTMAIIDIRLLKGEPENDVSGLILAKELPASLPKIMLSAYPNYQTVREELGLALNEVSPAVGFVDKNAGLQALLTTILFTLSPLPPNFKTYALQKFDAEEQWELRERSAKMGVRDSLLQLQAAATMTSDTLIPLREEARERASQLYKFGLLAKTSALALLTTAILLMLFGLTNEGVVAAIVSALAEGFDFLCGNQEKQAHKRADKLHSELLRTNQGNHWLLWCETFETPEARDECRKKVLEYILSQRSN